MKKTILIIYAAIYGWLTPLNAQPKVAVDNFDTERNGRNIEISFGIDLSQLDIASTKAILLTPRIVSGDNAVDLPAVGIYGRRRYYHYVRNGESMLTGKDETVFRTNKHPEHFSYHTSVPYSGWMSDATLKLICQEYGCCNSILNESALTLGDCREYIPEMVYINTASATDAAKMVKTDSITGTAYVIFEVNKTVLKPDIMNNNNEIGKINASIDTVRADKDITILNVELKGFASPESPYNHNAMLAKGRVEALKTHLQRMHLFDDGVIQTSYEPENWEGLRRFVEQSNMEHREEILSIIDNGMSPDDKEAAIKRAYPDEYRFLLAACYPMLRRTDYCIRYVVRNFTDINDIRRIKRTQPHKLSLNELYMLANSYEPGSDEYCEVFDVAVRMYPDNETVNLNAANAAMLRKDYMTAERCLMKAGDSPEAVYARGVYAFLNKDYDNAMSLLNQAREQGVTQVETVMRKMEKRKRDNKQDK